MSCDGRAPWAKEGRTSGFGCVSDGGDAPPDGAVWRRFGVASVKGCACGEFLGNSVHDCP